MMTEETPTTPPPGILPALPQRRAWPWALLLAVAHHVVAGLGFAVLASHEDVLGFAFFFFVGLVPLAFVVGLVRKYSFPGRVLMFAALYSCALFALEIAVAAGVCFFGLSKSGGFH